MYLIYFLDRGFFTISIISFLSLGETIVLFRLIWIKVLVCLCTLYFFISRTIAPSGLRVTTFDLSDRSWPILVRFGSERATGLIFDCSFCCFFSSLLAVLIFDLIVLRRADSFFHFSCALKDWPVSDNLSPKRKVNSIWVQGEE